MENITFEDFKKLDLRVAEIVEVQDVPGADKIYQLKIKIGEEERTIVAGIKPFYPKESLPGKKVAVLANLEPRTFRGVVSQGMLMAASLEDKSSLALLTLDREIASGSKIS